MNICLINPGVIEIPPKNWGAVENIIWNYKIHLEKIGHKVEILSDSQVETGRFDIVHAHMANQSLALSNRGIKNIFHIHDHHTVLWGKESRCYKDNKEAIEKSLLSITPGEFLIPYFEAQYKMFYLMHGVDLSKFTFKQRKEQRLLCVAANLYLSDTAKDRKGFGQAIEIAKRLNLPITIAGPSSNKKFFEQNKELTTYKNLNIVYDLNQQDLVQLYHNHSIFLHFSELEAGHPNLTLLEALSTGMAVVGTYLGSETLPGLKIARRDNIEAATASVKSVIDNYDNFIDQIVLGREKLGYERAVSQLEKIYESTKYYAPKTLKDIESCYAVKKSLRRKKTKRFDNHAVLESINDFYIISDNKTTKIVDLKKASEGFSWDKKEKYEQASWLYHEIFQNKDYEHEKCKVSTGDFVIDIGANIGVFTRFAETKGARKIISFEPESKNFDCLQKNATYICTPINAAISDKSGEIELKIDSTYGGHSLVQDNWSKTGNVQKVKSISLDDIFKNFSIEVVDFLKVDVEGAELLVFKGISDSNLLKIRKIGLEYHHETFGFDDSVLNSFIQRFKNLDFNVDIKDYGSSLKYIYIWQSKDKISVNFINGAFFEITGEGNKDYEVSFINNDTEEIIYSTKLKTNNWARTSFQHYIPYRIEVKDLSKNAVGKYLYDAKDRRVYIHLDSKALGDTIAWFPSVEQFAKKHNCKIICSTFHNHLFKNEYPDFEFVEPATEVKDIYAMYTVGIFDPTDRIKHPIDPRMVPLQRVANDLLGLRHQEIKPKIYIQNTNRVIQKKYVCIATTSTAQCKFWNYPGGWQKVVDYLKGKDLEVVLIQKEDSDLKNVIIPEDKNINTSINLLYNCEFFIGLTSGISWLAWALNKNVVMIAGFTAPWSDFKCIRIQEFNCCNSCWNSNHKFDPGNWLYCPNNKDFECTKLITPERVIKELQKLT